MVSPRFPLQLSPGPPKIGGAEGGEASKVETNPSPSLLRLPHRSIPDPAGFFSSKPKIPSTLVRARPPQKRFDTLRATSHGRQIDMKQQHLTTLGLPAVRSGLAWSK